MCNFLSDPLFPHPLLASVPIISHFSKPTIGSVPSYPISLHPLLASVFCQIPFLHTYYCLSHPPSLQLSYIWFAIRTLHTRSPQLILASSFLSCHPLPQSPASQFFFLTGACFFHFFLVLVSGFFLFSSLTFLLLPVSAWSSTRYYSVIFVCLLTFTCRILQISFFLYFIFCCKMMHHISSLSVYISFTAKFCTNNFMICFVSGSEGLCYSVEEGPKKSHFHYDRMVPVEILKITLQ